MLSADEEKRVIFIMEVTKIETLVYSENVFDTLIFAFKRSFEVKTDEFIITKDKIVKVNISSR
jgi:hypothetical protein